MPRRLFLPLLALVLLVSCHPATPKQYDPQQVNFQAIYNPIFQDQLYPSMLMGLASFSPDPDAISDTTALFSVSVTAPANGSVLRIAVDSSSLNYVTIFQESLPTRGKRYTFYPQLKWKYEKLYHLRQQGPVDITFHCYINDEEVDIKNLHLNYRSANDCLLSVRGQNGHMYDFRWLFAGYVNEEHPYIDSILTTMLHQDVVQKINGYQASSDGVVNQVEAIWYYALNRGIQYSSISCTPNPSKKLNVQHIRFFDEVYDTRQANCADACVFFASIMRKIGLKPVIFLNPCHAYLGYYTDKNRKSMRLLETTITAWVNFPALDRHHRETMRANPGAKGHKVISWQMYKKYGVYLSEAERKQWTNGKMSYEQFKHCIAHNLFLKASQHNVETHTQNLPYYKDKDNLQYQQLDIEQLRSLVQPIN